MASRRGMRTLDADLHVATRLRAARLEAGLSQEKAAEAVGYTFQQLQKYEKGANRISAGKLAALAHAYKKPVGWFFEGLVGAKPNGEDLGTQLIATLGGASIARAFLAIDDSSKRVALLEVAKALA